MPICRRTLILIGRDGNGKSSIGNAILGENFFTTTGSNKKNLDVQKKDKDEFIIFDSNGIGDTGEDMAGNMVSVVNYAKYKIVDEIVANSLTSIVFVLKYGTRFTKQEKDAVKMVKSIFGENVFRDFVIIAFSYGDLFEYDDRGDGCSTSFDQWCREQTGDIKDLFKEVGYRCILFNKHAPSHSDSIHKLRHHMGSLETIQTSALRVLAYHEQVVTHDVTRSEERVKSNYGWGCACCQCFQKVCCDWACCRWCQRVCCFCACCQKLSRLFACPSVGDDEIYELKSATCCCCSQNMYSRQID